MNIEQTRQIMSYLWATHPNAPKYTNDDKVRTIAAYFRVLYRYDLNDVLDAVDRICRESPTFIPSAYEIEKACRKTYDVGPFLPRKYHELDAQYAEFKYCIWEDLISARAAVEGAENVEARAAAQARVEGMRARKEIEKEMSRLYESARWDAEYAYDRAQEAIASNDLRALGYERLALEG